MASVKDSPITQFFYNLPGVSRTYHFVWAWATAKIHKHPSRKIFVIGVTGTKGKTTVLELINKILETAGKQTALLSSLRMKIGDESEKNRTGNSMPGHGFIQKFLKEARQKNCGYALIEVTSQGAELHRHRFIDWNIGVITNLHPEHIEAHGSYENYRKAKLGFLEYVLAQGGKVFLNRDDKEYPFFSEALAEQAQSTIAYSKDDPWFRNNISKARLAQSLENASVPKFILSKFNEENIAVAVAVARDLGIQDRVIEEAIVNFEGVPGRMEFVRKGNYTAVIDYAHTPESLEAAYSAARPEPTPYYPAPRLICVLSSAGGGRDRWKRPAMGAIADQYCDEIIITNEDPYDEDPANIMDEIETGIKNANPERTNTQKITDRRAAIRHAVEAMREGDVVIGTGKGSEEYIHGARGSRMPWSERAMFEEALRNKFEKETPHPEG